MKYNVTLVAGNRHNGAPQHGSSAEAAQAKTDWHWLTGLLASKIITRHERLGCVTADLSATEAAALLQDSRVYRVDPATSIKTCETVQKSAPWHLSRICGLQAEGTYSYTTTGRGVRVLVFDAGVYVAHPEFEHRAIQVYDAFDGVPLDTDHGTHVAGIIGGKTFGVAKECNILSLRVLLAAGGSDSDIIGGINWVLQNKAPEDNMVANFSLAGLAEDNSYILEQAILALITDGVAVAVAAGNDTADANNYSPARMPEVITVGAVDSDDVLADFSNFGSCVTVLAPGVNIISTGLNNTYVTLSGTSMATPVTTGIMARMRQQLPSMSQGVLKEAIPRFAFKGAAAHGLFDTTRDIVSANTVSCIEGSGQVRLLGLNPFKRYMIRPYTRNEDGSKTYGPSTEVSTCLGPAVLPSYGEMRSSSFASVSRAVTLQPAATPAVTVPTATSDMRYIGLTLDPDAVTDFSLTLGKASGTFQFGSIATPPNTKTMLSLQGLTGVVERVARNTARNTAPYVVQGRLLPLFQNENISLNLQTRMDSSPYTMNQIVSEIVGQAGTTIQLGLTGLLYENYQYTGRFVDALSSLAQSAGGELIQQNGTWYMVPMYHSIGSFSVLADDVTTYNVDLQTDSSVSSYASGLIQARKGIMTAQVQNAREAKTLAYALAQAEYRLGLTSSMTVPPTGSVQSIPPTAAVNLNYPSTTVSVDSLFGSVALASVQRSGIARDQSKPTLSGLFELQSSGAPSPSPTAQGKRTSIKSTLSMPTLKLAFGYIGNKWNPIDPNVLVEAPPWAWEVWPASEDSQHKNSKSGTPYYQTVSAGVDSYGNKLNKGLLYIDVFTKILIEVSLPVEGGILYGSGKLCNLDLPLWAGSETMPAAISLEVRQYEERLEHNRIAYRNKHYVALTCTSNYSAPVSDKNWYQADISLSYESYNPIPYSIDGVLTKDNFLLRSSDSKCIGTLDGEIFYGSVKDVLGTYDTATKTFTNINGNVVASVDEQGNLRALNGALAGKLTEKFTIDAPIFGGEAVISGYQIYNSVGDPIGQVATNLKTIQSLTVATVTVIYNETEGTIYAWVDRDGFLVLRDVDKRVAIWDGAGCGLGTVNGLNEFVVQGGLGEAVFGVPSGHVIGKVGTIQMKHVSDHTTAYVQSNLISASLNGSPFATIDRFSNIVGTDGTVLGYISNGVITVTNDTGMSRLGLSGIVGEKCGYITDRPAGLYTDNGQFVAGLVGNIVRSPGGRQIGRVRKSGLVMDNDGNLFGTIGADNVLQAAKGTVLGYKSTAIASETVGYILDQIIAPSVIIGRYTISEEFYLQEYEPGNTVSSNMDDDWAPYVDDNAFVPDNYYQQTRNELQEAVDEAQKLRDEIAANKKQASMLQSNRDVIDAALRAMVKTKGVMIFSALEAMHKLQVELDALASPVYDPARPAPILTYAQTLTNRAKEQALQDQLTVLDRNLVQALSDLKIGLQAVSISFIYSNSLPLPGNRLLLVGAGLPEGSFGAVDTVTLNGAIVTVTAKQYVDLA